MTKVMFTYLEERRVTQELIRRKFGDDSFDQAYSQFCLKCLFKGPDTRCTKNLIPLTSEGKSCPYFTV